MPDSSHCGHATYEPTHATTRSCKQPSLKWCVGMRLFASDVARVPQQKRFALNPIRGPRTTLLFRHSPTSKADPGSLISSRVCESLSFKTSTCWHARRGCVRVIARHVSCSGEAIELFQQRQQRQQQRAACSRSSRLKSAS